MSSHGAGHSSSFSLLLSSLALCDTKVYEPYIRARLGSAAGHLTARRGPVRATEETLSPDPVD